MERHKCKICNRRFANGRALGGHMRSHLAKLPVPPKAHQPREEPIKHSFEPSTPSQLSFTADLGEDSAVRDRTSEADSSQALPRFRRSKRVFQLGVAEPIDQLVTSFSDTSPEEDVALCLMMLSRDSRAIPAQIEQQREEELEEEEEKDEQEIEKPRNRSGYRCNTCKKLFRSYQALGGHRSSHKKIKVLSAAGNDLQHQEEDAEQSGVGDSNVAVTVDQRTFECPYCFKVFESGQALGGHKKVHPLSSTAAAAAVASTSAANNAASSSARIGPNNFIDLNLPAPLDDDDDDSGPVAELSAVSDAAMYHAMTRR